MKSFSTELYIHILHSRILLSTQRELLIDVYIIISVYILLVYEVHY